MAIQAEIYAIKACMMENIEKDCTGRIICMLPSVPGETGQKIKGSK
jgi:hypothetical protein